MERRIPDPLTIEDVRRDPDLMLAVQVRARRMRSIECGELLATYFRRLLAWRPAPRATRPGHRWHPLRSS